MKELQEQLSTVQHEVKQQQLRCQELEEQLRDHMSLMLSYSKKLMSIVPQLIN